MSRHTAGNSASSISLRLTGGAADLPSVADRAIYQYWSLLVPHFRGIFLPPQWRADGTGVTWSWRGAATPAGLSTGDLATIRRRLNHAQRSIADAAEDAPATDPRHSVVSLQQISVCTGTFVATLAGLPDPALAAYVIRSEQGLMLHSWGLPTALDPAAPNAGADDPDSNSPDPSTDPAAAPKPRRRVLLPTIVTLLLLVGGVVWWQTSRTPSTRMPVSPPHQGPAATPFLQSSMGSPRSAPTASRADVPLPTVTPRRALASLPLTPPVHPTTLPRSPTALPTAPSTTAQSALSGQPSSAPSDSAVANPSVTTTANSTSPTATPADPLMPSATAASATPAAAPAPPTSDFPSSASAQLAPAPAPPSLAKSSSPTSPNHSPLPPASASPTSPPPETHPTSLGPKSAVPSHPTNSSRDEVSVQSDASIAATLSNDPPAAEVRPVESPPRADTWSSPEHNPGSPPRSSEAPPPGEQPTTRPTADPASTASTLPLRRIRSALSPWQVRLQQDAILPTRPTARTSSPDVSALRRAVFAERQAEIPGWLHADHVQLGYTLTLPVSALPARWVHVPSHLAAQAIVSNTHAEFFWKNSTALPSSPVRLIGAAGQVLATLEIAAAGSATLTTSPSISGWPWIALAAPRSFDWEIIRGPAASPSWHRDDSAHRLDLIPGPGDQGLHQRTLALVDPVTGWSLVSEFALTVDFPAPHATTGPTQP